MQRSRDSSVWRSLAAAFGDGLAFGVGMKLSQNAAKRSARTDALPEVLPPAATAPVDRRIVEAVVTAVDERLREHAGQMERRIAELETKVSLELASLGKRDEALASAVEEVRTSSGVEIAELRRQIADNGSASQDLLAAIGQACRDAAGRRGLQ